MIATGKLAPFVFTVANVWLAVATSSELVKNDAFKGRVFSHLLRYWAQYYFIMIGAGLCFLLFATISRRRQLHNFLRHILDCAVEHDLKPGGVYDDSECKATIFRYRSFSILACVQHRIAWGKFAAPWAGWLVPIVRSGKANLSLLKMTVFRARHGSPSNGRHGVAGQIWAKGSHTFTAGARPGDGRGLRRYNKAMAKAMSLTQEEYDRRVSAKRSLSPYIYGRRIELSGGRHWGVVVFDSLPPADNGNEIDRPSDQLIVGILSRAIEWGQS